MSTTDRVPVVQPCPCGKGQVRYQHCTPDHAYARGSWTEQFEITCADCAQLWVFDADRQRLKPLPKGDRV